MIDKYDFYKKLERLLHEVPCCHNCPSAILDNAIGWLCVEQDYETLRDLYGDDYNPFEVADNCEFMKGYW